MNRTIVGAGRWLYRPLTPKWFDKSIFDYIPKTGKVLNVGSGNTPRFTITTTNLDIEKYPNVDIVADAHQLPFPDNYFDCVFCSAVLEHTARPWIVAIEMQRVLKDDGILCVQVPFLEGIHDEFDYFRFTPRGLMSLFPKIKLVKPLGVSASSAQILTELIVTNVVLVFENTILELLIKAMMSWLVWPIQWLDIVFKKQNTTMIRHARAIYFVGRKVADC